MTVKTYVINLEKHAQRREDIALQLERLGLQYEIFSAVDGRALSEKELKSVYDKNKAIEIGTYELTRPEIGCSLSHLGIYKQMIRDNVPYALVLEDDAKLGEDVPALLARLESVYRPDAPSVVLLNYIDRYKGVGIVPLTETYNIVQIYKAWCAHGYFLTLAAAKNMVKALDPAWLAADRWHVFQERNIVNVTAIVPYCIGLTEQSNDSAIGEEGKSRGRYHACGNVLRYYLYEKFFFQLFVRPFFRLTKQAKTW